MHVSSDRQLILSPTDLSAFLACRHRTALDLAVAHGALDAPEWHDPLAQAMRERGLEHERRYLAMLRAEGRRIADLSEMRGPAADAATRAAMADGVDVVYQASLSGQAEGAAGARAVSDALDSDGASVDSARTWRGRADVLVRVARPSVFGPWSYEAHDTKLARETRGGTVLQLAAYSDLLAAVQGVAPEFFHVVMPAPAEGLRVESFRVDDYAAHYRRVRAALLGAVDAGHKANLDATYPEPVEHCELCRWWERCNARRREDDHLGFIAGIGRTHRREFVAREVPTLAAAAALPHPLPFTPARGSRETYERFRDQAALQHRQRTTNTLVHELLPVQDGLGLARLPEPSPGDLFLDLEGAAFARDGGREYLVGICLGDCPQSGWAQTIAWARPDWGQSPPHPRYLAVWAHDDAEERAAFEALMDLIERQWTAFPDMHVYHFAPYEPSALKRLMGRYATRGELLDRLLRGERFVDLLAVVRQSLRAGVESYSIKALEPYYRFEREVPLADARTQLTAIELALESHAPDAISDTTRAAVEGYNRDDCRSTSALRDWLERLRAEAIDRGAAIPRPQAKDEGPPDEVGELEARQQAARARLLDGLASEAAASGGEGHERWLLAYLIDWHRREEKADWWEHFRLAALPPDDLFDEPAGIAGLEFVERVDVVLNKRTLKPTGSVIDRYRYPAQDTEVGRDKVRRPGGDPFGEVVEHNRVARTIDIKKGKDQADVHPPAIYESDTVRTIVLQESLLRLVDGILDTSCGLDLLHRRPPRLRAGTLDPQPGESLVAHARRLALSLDRTTLAVQGPPGSGKTYLGAQMIRALVAAGKRVGVVAPSHKVIVNLLDAVADQAAEAGESVRLGRKLGKNEEAESDEGARFVGFRKNEDAADALARRDLDVLGGTAWLWAEEVLSNAVDVLVVDEAGQFSLANALAVSPAADSLVLLGDPQQLAQPQKGSHPDGVDVSALQHVLGDAPTMPPDRGLFLPTTWRLAPSVCAFTSELFYDGKLVSRDGLAHQRLVGTQGFDGAGLWWHPVAHEVNRHWSLEEIDAVAALVDRLLVPGAQWIDGEGAAHALAPADILVVAPYNAHVSRLAERLADRGVRVGTVDKFQGQEAPVVVFAMAASTPADAPRGMDFLYSRHRLNVATSRARCAAIVVASPALLEPECRTPGQMRRANALCRFVEMAAPPSAENYLAVVTVRPKNPTRGADDR